MYFLYVRTYVSIYMCTHTDMEIKHNTHVFMYLNLCQLCQDDLGTFLKVRNIGTEIDELQIQKSIPASLLATKGQVGGVVVQAICVIDRPSLPGRFFPCTAPGQPKVGFGRLPKTLSVALLDRDQDQEVLSPQRLCKPRRPSHCLRARTALPPEPLLTRGIPDLELDAFSRLDLHQAGEKIHPHGGVRNLGKATLGEAADQAGLAHCGIPDDNEPELVQPDGLHGRGSAGLLGSDPGRREGAPRRRLRERGSAGSSSAASASLTWEPEAGQAQAPGQRRDGCCACKGDEMAAASAPRTLTHH